jgi:hypothetical protein
METRSFAGVAGCPLEDTRIRSDVRAALCEVVR